jgi:hypothetical protein
MSALAVIVTATGVGSIALLGDFSNSVDFLSNNSISLKMGANSHSIFMVCQKPFLADFGETNHSHNIGVYIPYKTARSFSAFDINLPRFDRGLNGNLSGIAPLIKEPSDQNSDYGESAGNDSADDSGLSGIEWFWHRYSGAFWAMFGMCIPPVVIVLWTKLWVTERLVRIFMPNVEDERAGCLARSVPERSEE